MGTKIKLDSIDPEDPNNKKEQDAVDLDIAVQEFDSTYSSLETVDDLTDKMIFYLERMVRASYEYRQYITYLKNELELTKCALTPGLDITNIDFKLEFHHYPITLYDICEAVARKQIMENTSDSPVSSFNIMEEVMKDHYEGIVGLVPLSESSHQMAHSCSVKIPYSSVNGTIDTFMKKYEKYIDPAIKEKVQLAKLISETEAKDFNEKLNKNILNYNVKYNKSSEKDDDELSDF